MLVALGATGTLSGADLLISAVAVIPIQFGMPAGRWLRRRTDPALFRFGVLIVLAAGGIDLLHRALSNFLCGDRRCRPAIHRRTAPGGTAIPAGISRSIPAACAARIMPTISCCRSGWCAATSPS
ncbi:MAG TPA: hypothetical protein VND87_15190 [Stellaceae bacterium]|nr:hypothetical protein [Stellaceae bacterium]